MIQAITVYDAIQKARQNPTQCVKVLTPEEGYRYFKMVSGKLFEVTLDEMEINEVPDEVPAARAYKPNN